MELNLKTRITQETWSDISHDLANGFRPGGQLDPTKHSPAAMERFMYAMKDYVYDVKNVRSKFKSVNNCILIPFQNDAARRYYDAAWERFQIEAAKVDKTTPEGRFRILVEFLQFRKAAEYCRAELLADYAYECITSGNKDCVIAVNFKQTIVKAVKTLIRKYGLKRKDISLIWGGDNSLAAAANNTGIVFSDQEIASVLSKLVAAGATKAQQDLVVAKMKNPAVETDEEKELRQFVTINKLGPQSRADRQEEIDRFQQGKSRVAMFTFKSGGVGLSLHHTDEWAEVDAVTGSKLVKSRQRRAFLAPTYSAIEIVQGLGRAHRITSLSDTEQSVVFYRGTIEETVYKIVALKMRCLRKVTQAKESWDSLITEGKKEDNFISESDCKLTEIATDNEEEEDNNIADLQATGEDEDET